jgi:DNA-damage-inducible protein D
VTPIEYKKIKGLKSQNLRDHMSDLELIFSMLGEASTTKVTRAKNAKGFIENKVAARIGGKIAGNALKELEKESGEKVITSENYLSETKKPKELKIGKKK